MIAKIRHTWEYAVDFQLIPINWTIIHPKIAKKLEHKAILLYSFSCILYSYCTGGEIITF
jgi:hypothetical protein